MLQAWFTLMIALVLPAEVQAQAHAQRQERMAFDFARDHFAAGDVVSVPTPVAGDLIAAGGRLGASAAVGGDAVLAGGEIRVDGRVGQDLYAAGGDLAVRGVVARNARMAGGQVTITPDAEIGGNVSAAGGEIRVEGRVNGYLQARGGRVYIDAPIGGNVDIMSGDIELGPNANIAGRLRFASDNDLQRAATARVHGGIERRPPPSEWSMPGRFWRQVGAWVLMIWTFGIMLLAALFVAILPGVSARVASTLQRRPGKSLLTGLGILIGVPILVLLLLMTLIGIPLGLLGIALYFALLFLGYVGTSVALGDWALRRFKPADAGKRAWRIGASVLAVLAIGLVGQIPGLGVLIVLLALLAGIGAWILLMRQARSIAPIVAQ